MIDLSAYMEGEKAGACDAIQRAMQAFHRDCAHLLPADSGAREVFDLELRKGLAEACWHRRTNAAPYSPARAVAVAFAALYGSLPWCSGQLLSGSHPAIYAVHGEWSTRSRHLWQYLSGRKAAVLILGRPLGAPSLPKLRRLLSDNGIDTQELTLLRPFSPRAFARGLRGGVTEIRQFLQLLPSFVALTNVAPDTAQLVAILYRLLLGRIHAAWLDSRQWSAPVCTFAHTGMADTGRLDWAMRRHGTVTRHWFHGVSHGQNFFGYSSEAICRSRFDVDLTNRLGGYGRAAYVQCEAPALKSKGEGWVVLSNWLHPQNESFRLYGPRDEFLLLDQVAQTAARLGMPPAKVVWKPHPVFGQLPPALQSTVRDRVAALGFAEWSRGQSIAAVAEFDVAISTVSTTIIDLLKLGMVPILHTLQVFDSAIYAAAVPGSLHVATADELAGCIESLADTRWRNARFQEAWAALGPGADIVELEAL